ncbi:hypothetical protein D1BOALGB6SA_10009 [Olavius sp. associated proteobacterium Delta 1]|nr:hypothetical protein D1BOALGB6SA_10009 [Olavius sp. associated proteobacterium Delta 1]
MNSETKKSKDIPGEKINICKNTLYFYKPFINGFLQQH